MDKRPIIYAYEQARSFDTLSAIVYALQGDSRVSYDLMGASGTTVVSGGAASATAPASLSINIAPISIYQMAEVDATAYGDLAANSASILQIGDNAASTTLTLSTSGLAAGQSQWALVEANLLVSDSIAPGDPNGGLLLYYNASNPTVPYQGQNNNGQLQNTLRSNLVQLSVVYGTPATTGSEVPPTPSTGAVGLYLIDLTYGQTQISTITVAGPSAGTNVPSNYPYAPFLAGLLNSHHSGHTGQAPQINLATETQGNFARVVQASSPPPFDNSLNLATTEWINSRGISFSGQISVSASTVLTASQAGNLIYISGTAAAITVTLPLAGSASVGSMIFPIVNASSYTVTIAFSGSDTSTIPNLVVGPGQSLIVMNNGTASWSQLVGSNGSALSPLTVGNAVSATEAVALGQTYNSASVNNVTASRALNTTYTNSTGKPMQVYVWVAANPSGGYINLIGDINGVGVYQENVYGATTISGTIPLLVPPGATYYANANATLQAWVEIY